MSSWPNHYQNIILTCYLSHCRYEMKIIIWLVCLCFHMNNHTNMSTCVGKQIPILVVLEFVVVLWVQYNVLYTKLERVRTDVSFTFQYNGCVLVSFKDWLHNGTFAQYHRDFFFSPANSFIFSFPPGLIEVCWHHGMSRQVGGRVPPGLSDKPLFIAGNK